MAGKLTAFFKPKVQEPEPKMQEGAEHGRAADAAGQLGVPARRPPRAAATAANAAMDALDQRGKLV